MSNETSMTQAYCGCPVRLAPEIRGDAGDTITEHVDGCTADCAESKVWSCPRPGCGYRIADGPVEDGDVPTSVLISEHLDEHHLDATYPDLDLDPLDEWPQPDGGERAPVLVDGTDLDLINLDAAPAEPTPTERFAAHLRALADFVTVADVAALPSGDYLARYGLDRLSVPVQTRAEVAAWVRAGMRAGAEIVKHQSDAWAGVDVRLGPGVALHVYAARDEVCERVVTGTREVTVEVPDPVALAAVPTVSVKRTVEDVEWRCGSILAPTPVAEAALPQDAVTA